ncbi:cytidylyltransferase domain-containing protein [Flavobacterium sp.]|jgi:CMP-N-acetylneuraminic acid synthetase|uniref:acylneuraminate cytidylyltransferase family protein n=1 Tax=Flavobacterium sp. TaxID=239 RepID=UPI0037C118BC
MNKTIAIIPARGGSKRLPNKNTLLLGGIPLLAHSILYAQANSEIIDEVFVTTNDKEIKKVALQLGAKVIDRPDAISGDLEPTITALQHVMSSLEYEVENCVLLQPTNPLRPKKMLYDCFQKYQELKIDSLFTVTRNHQKFGMISNDKFSPFNYKIGQRSQDLEPLFFENGLLYITNSKSIKKGEIITENAFPFIINHIFAQVDIDTQEDFDYAEYLYNNS